MIELTSVTLENEMDLILAHKQSMRVAELTGLSIAAQTTFATAVSEVCRSVIGKKANASLTLSVSPKSERWKSITAVLEDTRANYSAKDDEGYMYARKLVSNVSFQTTDNTNRISLAMRLPVTSRIDDGLVEKWKINLNNDPSISPYEEIKRKNRQLAELAEKLQQSEHQYKVLTDSLPIMILSIDHLGWIHYANKWVTDYTGQSVEQLNQTKWVDAIHPDDFTQVWKKWEGDAEDLVAATRPERRIKDAMTGDYRWHIGISTPIHNDEGKVTIWNVFMVDVHAQKTIEETLRDNAELKFTQAALEEKIQQLNLSNQQLEQFAYIASHDLQEPLRKITLYSDFLNKKLTPVLPKEASVYFENLITAAARMKMLIQDILAYSTLNPIDFAPVNLNEIAAETIEDMEISITEKSAEIVIDKLPVVYGNASQLKQLFENLLSNSLKYCSPDTKPQIAITSSVSENIVELRFSDNGIGFEQEYTEKMFNIFQRLHTRDKYSGTGIGLAICKKIVEMHNGDIQAISTTGNGSTFTVRLPSYVAE